MPEASNPNLFLYCLWRLGSGGNYIPIEELYEECWRVAPSRFGWRTKRHPSDKAGDQAMRDIQKAKETKSFLLLSGDRESIRLSADGVVWVREHLDQLDQLAEQRAPSQKRSQKHLIDLETSVIGQALLRNERLDAGRIEVADLLQLTPDADSASFRQRLVSYRADAELAARADTLTILERLEASRPEWFNGKDAA
jgi:hypothetical protein